MPTILIVDDQPLNRQFLLTLLGYFGHKVLEAGNGSEALETLKSCHVDLVISDVLMPTMDGYDFLNRLRADAKFGRTPVIFYTAASYEPQSRAIAQAHGVEHFLTKPAETQCILEAVNSALGHGTPAPSLLSLSKFNDHLLKAPFDPIDREAIVFVVDDDATTRDSLAEMATDAHLNMEAFATAEAFLKKYDPRQSGCLVLEICLPGMTGIALLETLRARRVQIPVIILTAHGYLADVVDAMRLGVMDFLEKPLDRRILLSRIYRVLQEDSIKRREKGEAGSIRIRMAALTACEKDLLNLLILGRSSKEMATELRISIKTVSHHRAHLLTKTKAANSADLVRMGIIDFNN